MLIQIILGGFYEYCSIGRGLSTERDVSFVTGNEVAQALRRNGHQVILLDLFMGHHDKEEDLEGIFAHSLEASVKETGITGIVPDLEAVKRSRKDQSPCLFGPNVIALCRMADIVFLALHGENGEDGRVQAAFDLYGIKYTGTGYLEAPLPWIKDLQNGFLRQIIFQSPQVFL